MSKPIPAISDINRDFFEGCAKGELRIRHCPRCDARFRFVSAWCPNCFSAEIGYERASGRGVITHLTVVHQAPYPAFEDATPYVLALIDLEEGVRVMSNIVGCPPEAVRIGTPVEVVFEQRGDVTLPMFTPTD